MRRDIPILLVEDDTVDFPQFLDVVKTIDRYWSLSEMLPCLA